MNSYPVRFQKDLSKTRPTSVALLGKKYVIWKTKDGINCVEDKCAHRGAKLSQGRIVNDKCIECPYHGWQYDKAGTCVKIPQQPYESDVIIPKACNVNHLEAFENDGIVWLTTSADGMNNFDFGTKYLHDNKYFVTDYFLNAPYNYFYQIENLLDPAHLEFIHDGFQSKREYAGPIYIKDMKVTNKEISTHFVHENKNVPDIVMTFKLPHIVEVSILNKEQQIVRKNIIHVTPSEKGRCNVLFRDVAFKEFFTPQDNQMLRDHVSFFIDYVATDFVNKHYQIVNKNVVEAIIQQDIEVITGQQEMCEDYWDSKYVLPTESDKLIIEFRKWARKNKDILRSYL